MKIAILTPYFLPDNVGGSEVAAYNIAKYLALHNHQVHVVTSSSKGLPKQSIESNFFVHRVNVIKGRFIHLISYAFSSIIMLLKINPDVIHVQSTASGISAMLINNIKKSPYIVYCQGSDVYLPWFLKKEISTFVFGKASSILALTNDMKLKIQDIYNTDVVVLPNGVDLLKFLDVGNFNVRNALNIQPTEHLLLFVGRLHQIKGLEYLVKAMKLILLRHPNTKLAIIGEGKEKQNIINCIMEHKLENNIILVGHIPHAQIPIYMLSSDVFILPSLSEGLPLVCLEAMAAGLPIIATRVGGLPEIIEEGINGFLVDPGKPEQIAESLCVLLDNKELRYYISKQNKKKVNVYSWESIVTRLERIYISVLSKYNIAKE